MFCSAIMRNKQRRKKEEKEYRTGDLALSIYQHTERDKETFNTRNCASGICDEAFFVAKRQKSGRNTFIYWVCLIIVVHLMKRSDITRQQSRDVNEDEMRFIVEGQNIFCIGSLKKYFYHLA